MVRGSLSEDEVPDQEVLRKIEEWRTSEGRSPALAQYLYGHEKSVRVWERLDESVETPQLLELAGHLFEIMLQKVGARASADHNAAVGLWRRAIRRLGRNAPNAGWLIRHIRQALPISLQLVVSLYYYWASPRYGIIEQDGRDSCRIAAVEDFKSLLDKRGADALIRIVDNAHPFTIAHLVFPPDHEVMRPSVLREASAWQWLAPVLLSAAKIAPENVVPQIACLNSKSRVTDIGEAPVFVHGLDLDDATGIFGDHMHELMDCLTQVPVVCISCPEVLASVRSEANAWLKANPRP